MPAPLASEALRAGPGRHPGARQCGAVPGSRAFGPRRAAP